MFAKLRKTVPGAIRILSVFCRGHRSQNSMEIKTCSQVKRSDAEGERLSGSALMFPDRTQSVFERPWKSNLPASYSRQEKVPSSTRRANTLAVCSYHKVGWKNKIYQWLADFCALNRLERGCGRGVYNAEKTKYAVCIDLNILQRHRIKEPDVGSKNRFALHMNLSLAEQSHNVQIIREAEHTAQDKFFSDDMRQEMLFHATAL